MSTTRFLHPRALTLGAVAASLLVAGAASADATITVDGNLSDWPSPVFTFLDGSGDTWSWRDIVQVWVTDDNASGSDGNLYFAIEFASDFIANFWGVDIDVYVYLDVDGDGTIGGSADRIIEATEGTVTDGDGNPVGSIADMAYSGRYMEIAVPYSVLGLSYGSDDFGIAFETTGWRGFRDRSPNVGEGDGGFIVYSGTDPVPLAVTLAELGASVGPRGVTVHWSTASERNNLGFHVYRLESAGRRTRLTEQPLPGLGDSALGRDYELLDARGRAGTRYVIEDLDASGAVTAHGPVQARREPRRAGLVERLARGRAARPAPPARPAWPRRSAARVPHAAGGTYQLAVRESGLIRLSVDALRAAGIDPRRGLVLRRAGGAVPVLQDGADLLLVGTPERDRYADFEVLRASAGHGVGLEERAVSGACEAAADELAAWAEIEQQRVYYVKPPTEDPFYWAQAYAGRPARLSFEVPSPAEGEAELWLHATGIASLHAVSLTLNDTELGAVSWTGTGLEALRFTVPQGVLRATNELVVEAVAGAEFDLMTLDRLRVNYPRRLELTGSQLELEVEAGTCVRVSGIGDADPILLDVTEPERPELLGGYVVDEAGALRFMDSRAASGGVRRYLVSRAGADLPEPELLGALTRRTLRSRSLGADSLVVTHPEFAGAAARLAGAHQRAGLETMLVSTQEIYDAFGFGRPGAEPIRELLETAGERWRRAPAYVTLVGGSTVDSNGHLPESAPDWVPTPFRVSSTTGYEAASDSSYVSDARGAPWAAIGRLPVDSAAEADALVTKLVEGAAALRSAPSRRLLIVADSYAGYGATTDVFEQAALRLQAECAGDSLAPELLLKSQAAAPVADLREQASSGIDALAYFGHGFLTGWSSSPVLLSATQAGTWRNERPFLLLSWTCFDGAFVGPWGESLAAALLRNPSGGALLATAATTLEDPGALERLARELVCRLGSGEPERVGDALREAKASLAGRGPALTELLFSYGLLGDPTTPNPWR